MPVCDVAAFVNLDDGSRKPIEVSTDRLNFSLFIIKSAVL